MGVVYKARDLKDGREVAVKRLRGELAGDPRMREEFLQEARTVAALNHPNIVSFVGSLEAAGVIYLVFEFLEGETLRDLAAARGALPPHEVVKILGQVCAALAHSHERSVHGRALLGRELPCIQWLRMGAGRHRYFISRRRSAGGVLGLAPGEEICGVVGRTIALRGGMGVCCAQRGKELGIYLGQ
jgi:serine/threonine protein kinase